MKRFAVASLLALVVAGGAAVPANACEGVLPDAIVVPGGRRPVTSDDLLRLRDIGFPDASIVGPFSPLSVSPDGTAVAFVLNRADPDTNGYCRALVVLPLRPGGRPRIIDRGGELITVTDVQRGLFVPGGFPNIVVPAWSPDGRTLAYLKRVNGRTQAWRVATDGSGASAVTDSPVDVEGVAWSSDGGSLLFSSRPAVAVIKRAHAHEADAGYLYDERIVTYSGGFPQIRAADAPLVFSAIDLASGAVRAANAEETDRLGRTGALGAGRLEASTTDGRRAWIAPDPGAPLSRAILKASGRRGVVACAAAACRGGIVGLWWDDRTPDLLFLRRQGWANGETALYRWRPGAHAPRQVFATEDAVLGCRLASRGLVCLRENATTPRRVVLIDPATGKSTLLFDPNPEFAGFEFGSVRRLKWRNAQGLEAWGDFVLPPGYRAGTRVPLVVVQYHSDGFLRGGTADEFPIFPFAAQGIAVLSLEAPPPVTTGRTDLRNWDEIVAAEYRGWSERRSKLSGLLVGVDQVVATGTVDPARIGITGLSDGSSTVRFALINTPGRFAAASIATCCFDPKTVMTYGGIAFAEYNRKMGFPPATTDDPKFWKPFSLALNAATMDTPLLMQLPSDEYLISLEAFEALREHRKPVEMYVFPDEYHAKWQPRHRLAAYRRNLDWFGFWLQDRIDPDPEKAAQYARWQAMRATMP
ncbi:Atxe2 family lasso peptide isopeptidase [Sphingomonas sp. DT-204]|uniref:Atxe2 family lasso peptide isopeptidase n=1 Tax=Sphingomonas sp. DT-204 TaxID=3396166 RepID=UPI003F1B4BBB